MHDHLHRALTPVLHDLEATGAPVPRVEDSDWQDWPGAESALLWSADRSGAGVWVDTGKPDVEQIAMLADQAQDWVVEELARAGATNWPPCPDHPDNHPLTAGVQDGTAAWSCPASGRVVSEIGRLGSAE